MDADLDLLLTVVYCIADDFLPERAANARRTVADAEIVALAIAQALLGCRSDAQFIALASRRLRHLFPALPERSAFHKAGCGSRTRSSGCSRTSRATAKASMTTCCSEGVSLSV